MISKNQIINDLRAIALNNNYKGEAVEMIIDLLTYSLYNEQVQIVNAIRESSISTAYSINSKIAQSMGVMYSVYRGKNPTVKFRFINNTLLSYNKLGLIYKSNSVRVYSDSTVVIQPSIDNSICTLSGILCSTDKYTSTKTITESDRYYVDAEIDDSILTDLSEDIKVSINNVEYPTTRSFYDHMHTPIESNGSLDKLFILTIPGYGIRVYKKGYIDDSGSPVGYFKINDTITIECLKYTTLSSLNSDELKSMSIQGTELVNFDASDNQTYKGIKLNNEVSRENDDSILYNANYYSRIQSNILSKSDVNVLFTEYFIEYVYSSANEFIKGSDSSKDSMTIYYILKNGSVSIDSKIPSWRELYKSYFITETINTVQCIKLDLYIDIEVYVNDGSDILSDVTNILSEYENKINLDSNTPLLNSNLIIAKINKISNVAYVSKFIYLRYMIDDSNSSGYTTIDSSSDELVPIRAKDSTGAFTGTPYYYNITPNITYKYTYETVSE
jgi:hypothetical protein